MTKVGNASVGKDPKNVQRSNIEAYINLRSNKSFWLDDTGLKDGIKLLMTPGRFVLKQGAYVAAYVVPKVKSLFAGSSQVKVTEPTVFKKFLDRAVKWVSETDAAKELKRIATDEIKPLWDEFINSIKGDAEHLKNGLTYLFYTKLCLEFLFPISERMNGFKYTLRFVGVGSGVGTVLGSAVGLASGNFTLVIVGGILGAVVCLPVGIVLDAVQIKDESGPAYQLRARGFIFKHGLLDEYKKANNIEGKLKNTDFTKDKVDAFLANYQMTHGVVCVKDKVAAFLKAYHNANTIQTDKDSDNDDTVYDLKKETVKAFLNEYEALNGVVFFKGNVRLFLEAYHAKNDTDFTKETVDAFLAKGVDEKSELALDVEFNNILEVNQITLGEDLGSKLMVSDWVPNGLRFTSRFISTIPGSSGAIGGLAGAFVGGIPTAGVGAVPGALVGSAIFYIAGFLYAVIYGLLKDLTYDGLHADISEDEFVALIHKSKLDKMIDSIREKNGAWIFVLSKLMSLIKFIIEKTSTMPVAGSYFGALPALASGGGALVGVVGTPTLTMLYDYYSAYIIESDDYYYTDRTKTAKTVDTNNSEKLNETIVDLNETDDSTIFDMRKVVDLNFDIPTFDNEEKKEEIQTVELKKNETQEVEKKLNKTDKIIKREVKKVQQTTKKTSVQSTFFANTEYSSLDALTANWDPKLRTDYLKNLQNQYTIDELKVGDNTMTQIDFQAKWKKISEDIDSLSRVLSVPVANQSSVNVSTTSVAGTVINHRITRSDVLGNLLRRSDIMVLLLNGELDVEALLKLVDAIMRSLEVQIKSKNSLNDSNDEPFEKMIEELRNAMNKTSSDIAELIKNSNVIQQYIAKGKLQVNPTQKQTNFDRNLGGNLDE